MTMTMDNRTTTRTHSGIGIASFIIGATSVAFVMGLVGTAGVMAQAGKATHEFNMIIGLGVFAAGFVDLIGIALGFFGAVDRSSKKVYPVLGLVLNTVVLLSVAALVAIGLAMKAT